MSDTLTPSAQDASIRNVPGWIRAIEIIAGIILVVLSFNIWGYPLVAGISVIYMFGLALIILGTVRMGTGIFETSLGSGARALVVILGILLLLIGFYAIAYPAGGAVTLIYFFAFGLMLAGIDLIVRAGAGLPGPDAPDWVRYLSIAAGIFALLIGFIALLYPGFGAALLFILISLGLLVLGIDLIATGIIGRRLAVP
ncbi:MAG: DUF308 domain-containing protein [Methanoregulaceae archaeon]|jgi:uncharacterized membrane protein HdeD (DUF308 family)|nr:DUF308 domain-containing protein [Methanoregulaceae archaeon]